MKATPFADFEAAHERGETPLPGRFVPHDAEDRPSLLRELVLLDVRHRRRRGLPVRVADYLAEEPALADDPVAMNALVRAEFHARTAAGESLSLRELAAPFGVLADTDTEAGSRTLPPTAAAGPGPGIEGYEILGELGRGGMAVVYKARHRTLLRVSALKMILSGAQADEGERERFLREARAIAGLDHPGIVRIHETGTHDGQPWLSLEFCAGGSLSQRLRGNPLPPRLAAEVVRDIARALQPAHDAGIIHRDLKPANILLADDGFVPRIADFGLARRIDDVGHTVSGMIVGTPSYMAPEQAQGRLRDITPASDIYALGAILYECLTGRPPFRAATTLETVLQVISDDPAPPTALVPSLPRDAEIVAMKCLSKSPAARYASAAEVADDLERYLRGEPIRARPVSTPVRVAKWMRRHPVLTAATLSAVAVAAVAFAVILRQLDAEQTQRQKAESAKAAESVALGLAVEEGEKARKSLAEATKAKTEADAARDVAEGSVYRRTIALALSEYYQSHVPIARQLLDQCPPSRRGWEWAYLHRLCRAELFDLELGPDYDLPTVAGPAGALTAFVFRGGKEKPGWSVSLMDYPLRSVANFGFEADLRPLKLAISHDEKRLAVATSAGVLVMDVASRKGLYARPFQGATVRHMLFHPDGRSLLVHLVKKGKGGDRVDPPHREPTDAGPPWSVRRWTFGTPGDVQLHAAPDESAGTCLLAPDGERFALVTRSTVEVRRFGEVRPIRTISLPGGVGGTAQTPDLGLHRLKSGDSVYMGLAREHVCFSPDARRLASGGGDGLVRIWDAATGALLRVMAGHASLVTGLAWSPAGDRVASISTDQTLRIWDATAGRLDFAHHGLVALPVKLAYSGDGRRLLVFDGRRHMTMWDAGEPPGGLRLPRQSGAIQALGRQADGRITVGVEPPLTEMDRPSTALRFDPTGVLPTTRIPLEGLALRAMAVDERSDRFVVAGWEKRPGKTFLEYSRILLRGGATSATLGACDADKLLHPLLAIRPGGEEIAYGGDIQTVEDISERRQPVAGLMLRRFGTAPTVQDAGDIPALVRCFAYSPDGTRLAVGYSDGRVQVRDSASMKVLSVTPTGDDVDSVAFHPKDGRLVATDKKGRLRVVDPGTGKVTATVALPYRLHHLTFSPDGTQLVGTSEDTIRLIDIDAGAEVLTLRGHTNLVSCLGFSADGRTLWSGDRDGTVRGWRGEPKEKEYDKATAEDFARRDTSWHRDRIASALALGEFDTVLFHYRRIGPSAREAEHYLAAATAHVARGEWRRADDALSAVPEPPAALAAGFLSVGAAVRLGSDDRDGYAEKRNRLVAIPLPARAEELEDRVEMCLFADLPRPIADRLTEALAGLVESQGSARWSLLNAGVLVRCGRADEAAAILTDLLRQTEGRKGAFHAETLLWLAVAERGRQNLAASRDNAKKAKEHIDGTAASASSSRGGDPTRGARLAALLREAVGR